MTAAPELRVEDFPREALERARAAPEEQAEQAPPSATAAAEWGEADIGRLITVIRKPYLFLERWAPGFAITEDEAALIALPVTYGWGPAVLRGGGLRLPWPIAVLAVLAAAAIITLPKYWAMQAAGGRNDGQRDRSGEARAGAARDDGAARAPRAAGPGGDAAGDARAAASAGGETVGNLGLTGESLRALFADRSAAR